MNYKNLREVPDEDLFRIGELYKADKLIPAFMKQEGCDFAEAFDAVTFGEHVVRYEVSGEMKEIPSTFMEISVELHRRTAILNHAVKEFHENFRVVSNQPTEEEGKS